ncbi:methyl-accepting chemotaxis protein [Cellvibrio japonicus]|uniref:Methyl-accepting chemotaxis protein n=1 Tax=Cellvibrio japonicus (strain Ueda107) TaxID=498211 RepID=B3PCP5_CELJU|nr:methyl-accepting chemotaxis protein [Cellvibrio japonicus]ACE85464.1 methyl-accepting chemotaxis protein [Cellvibrio japonicus Ueda107]
MNSLSMKAKLILLGLVPGFIILALFLILVSERMHRAVEKDIALLRDTLMAAHKTELRHSLDVALSLIKPLYDASRDINSPEARQALELLKRLKYGSDGYFFGYDGNSVRVFSGSDNARIGDSFRDYKDVNGVFLINELVKQARAGGGYVTYHFPRLGQGDTAYPKLSYAVWLEKWNLMLGTGFYVDGVDTTLTEAAAISMAYIDSTLLRICVIALGLLVVIAAVAIYLANKTLRPLNNLIHSLESIAQGGGDLTRRIPQNTRDEIGAVISAFNRFVDSIHGMIQRIQQLTCQVASISQQVSQDTSATFQTLDHQREQTLQVASAMNEMAASAVEVARSTQEAANAATFAESTTKDAQKTAGRSIDNIHALSEEVRLNTEGLEQLQADVSGIGAVSDVIRGIAEQTNLLALNASIEAARAGEQGRGFAVVADEVRALAARTQASTEEIQAMIQRLQASTSSASDSIKRSLVKGDVSVQMVGATAQALGEIDHQVSTINQRGLQIATAAEEQTQVIESINQNMHAIADATERASGYAAHSRESGESLAKVGEELQQLVGQFRT